jgi:hypothetical protein
MHPAHPRETLMSEQNEFQELGGGPFQVELDRRGAERHPCDLQPSWRVLGRPSGESWSGLIHDISTAGISLRVPCWMKPGTVLMVRLHGSTEKLSRPMPMRVMHATAQPDGEWLVGGMFVRPLTDEDLRHILHEN